MSWTTPAALALALAAFPATGSAEVEWTADLSLGGGVLIAEETREGLFRFGAHAEATFLRDSNRDFGVGVYGEVMTSTFKDVMGGAGALLLLPLHHAMPLVLFFGPHYVYSGHHDVGLGGRLWFGFHNHNHFHCYNGTFGVWVEARGNLTSEREVLIAAGLDIDLAVFVYPVMWIERWARGP
jgi:hypothetical protein